MKKKEKNAIVWSDDPTLVSTPGRVKEISEPKSYPAFVMNELKLTVKLDQKKRRGKVVTLIKGLGHYSPHDQENFLKDLKKICATGGTIEEDYLLIMGDQVKKLADYFSKKGIAFKL
jgi:translation initiation factor 1